MRSFFTGFDQPIESTCISINLTLSRKPGDLLIAFAPLGTEKAVLNTIANAVNKEIQVIALTGANNDAIQGVLAEADLEISIPATKKRAFWKIIYSS